MNGTQVVRSGTVEALQDVHKDVKTQASLRKACEDFEAFLVSYLLREMWQAAEAVGEEKPFISQAYRDMFTVEVAQSLAPSMGLGIAETLYRELSLSEGASLDAPKLTAARESRPPTRRD